MDTLHNNTNTITNTNVEYITNENNTILSEMEDRLNQQFIIDVNNAMIFLNNNIILSDFVKNFNEKGGFIFSSNPLMNEIIKGVDPNEIHSGASLAMCLRQCQYKLRNMME